MCILNIRGNIYGKRSSLKRLIGYFKSFVSNVISRVRNIGSIPIFLVATVFLLVPIEGHGYSPNVQYYYIDADFDEEQEVMIGLALEYIAFEVGCVEYRQVESPGLFEVGTLEFYRLPGPIREKGQGTVIGYYSTPIHNIFLSDQIYGESDELQDMPMPYFFKLIIHEVAHSLGMPGSHVYPREFAEISQLTPVIGHYSEPRYYERDVKYLRKLVCGK